MCFILKAGTGARQEAPYVRSTYLFLEPAFLLLAGGHGDMVLLNARRQLHVLALEFTHLDTTLNILVW